MADIQKTIENLKKNEFNVSFFETKEDAAEYLDNMIDGTTVGFGDSETLRALKMADRLEKHNTAVYDAGSELDNDKFVALAKKAMDTDIFMLSANAITESGMLVNIDGTGNRVAGSLFGHREVYIVAGTNKICETLDEAMIRARHVAAPQDTARFQYKTPCAYTGKCNDCHSPSRICNAMVIYMQKMNNVDKMEVVLINEELGY